MIRAKLFSEGSEIAGDGEALVDQWRASPGGRLWLDIEGAVTDDVRSLLAGFGCDQLAVTDASRARHPPKIEVFDDNTFLLFRGIASIDDQLNLEPQQIGLFVGSDFLITMHRGPSVSVNHFWDEGFDESAPDSPGLMAIQLLHYASGRYLDTLLAFEERLSELEELMLAEHSEDAMRELVAYRSRLRQLRRIFNYHMRLTDAMLDPGSPHVGQDPEETYHQRRDLFDRCERLHSLCSMYYEICGDLIEGYISISSHRLNNTMKVLTIITAIFVPLSFLAGVYGMNFEYIPELSYRYSYFFLLGVMALLATGMITLFRRMRWL